MYLQWIHLFAYFVVAFITAGHAAGQSLQRQLEVEDPAALAAEAREAGDAQRGAVVFHQTYMACSKCHVPDKSDHALGPDLTAANPEATDAYLVESILQPSKVIKKGFDTVSILTTDGKSVTGILVDDAKAKVVLRDAAHDFKQITIRKSDIDEQLAGKLSIMPAGQVNALASRQQFLDLVRYVFEIRAGGLARAKELQPPPSLLAARPLPDYEQDIDHAAMIAGLDSNSFKRGQAIYDRLCVNCHGTKEHPGSLPTSLRFATGKFKNGSDPYTMYQTLTRGFGMMVQQSWMVPEQKYDVIHYIREAYLKPHNPTEFFQVDEEYLAKLPAGSTRGPKPSNILPWEQMDYGPNLVATYEIGDDGTNFAYKGNAVRLDRGPGGVSRGRHWLVFDYDTLRVAAAWSGQGFINWQGINFDGRHNIHPRIVGDVSFANPTGPGWADPATGSFHDEQRVLGRDERRYGPLPRRWAHYQGMYYHGNDTIIKYTVGETDVLEMPALETNATGAVFKRVFNIGPRDRDMILQVARRADSSRLRLVEEDDTHGGYVVFGAPREELPSASANDAPLAFDGATFAEITKGNDFDLRDRDFTITARIKTKSGGTIFCKTADAAKWVPDGKTLFVRGGRLCYDIGWVGVVQSRSTVNDGRWHDVAVKYDAKTSSVRLYVDGKLDSRGELKPKAAVENHVVRLGYTAPDFPRGQSFFAGDLSEVRFYQRQLTDDEVTAVAATKTIDPDQLLGHWTLAEVTGERVIDQSPHKHDAKVIVGKPSNSTSNEGNLVAGIAGGLEGAEWTTSKQGDLRLKIPAGDQPLRFTLWIASVNDAAGVETLISALILDNADQDLSLLTKGGSSRWPEELTTTPALGNDDGPFAVDVLTDPATNPWHCRMRLTGFDFLPDGDRLAVCSWDGNVWMVSGLKRLSGDGEGDMPTLKWRRIASGLFQPLGLKIVNEKMYVTCRDQLCVLHDLNGDGEIDFYENFNNDHQVTDHFHEFAMGLQVDADGNFYYAKSARHALTAVVPHHGTLLRISKDGTRTDILATGFRAANGVCLNPDGTFIVTDQEGHWNPKNRINWVTEGGFYGNMFGYHDVTDSSDEAMQPPLCWITNSFDRSPAELMWVDSDKWGPLQGSLLNFSYGYGQIYVVPHEDINGQKQGGMCALPIPRLPTGVMRGRFAPADGQLYTCGMFAWAGSQQQPGGLYRIRYTGQPVQLPLELNARQNGIRIRFSGELDTQTASDAKNYDVKVWSLKRTQNYGSKHYDEHPLKVAAAKLSDDRKSLFLEIPGIAPTWCMEIKYSIQAADGKPVDGVIHNTIHAFGQ